jgi:subtilisin family serine protease
MKGIANSSVIICLALLLGWGSCSAAFAEQNYAPGEVLVRFKPEATAADIGSINGRIGCQVIREIKFIEVYHLRITSRLSVEDAVERYNRQPTVDFAEPNYRIGLLQRFPNNAERWPDDDTFDPAEPEYGWQWSLDNWGQTGGTVDADIDAPQMWRMITSADPDVIVAILDTGIDLDHPDLGANIWTNPDEIPGNGVDDDDNNYIDDVQGYDFVNGDNDPDDDDSHGTHVAGIIGAVGDNGMGIAGIAWNVQLMPIKVIEPNVASDHAANVCLGIDYAMHENAKIMNMSFRLFEYSQAVDLAIDRANDQGILVVAAAGNFASDNDADPLYPASYDDPNIIAVAASNHNDDLWFWGPGSGSNWGATSVDLAAPGEDIYSTVRVEDGSYASYTGTSMAAPHVSGVAALCWSLEPWLDHLQLKDLLLDDPESFNAADKEKKPAFQGLVLTEGRLRAAQNADFGDAADPPYPTSWPPLGWGAVHLDCGLEWLGEDISLERDALNLDGTDTDGVPNLVDMDGFDDGVAYFPPYFCKPFLFDRVDVVVTVSDPISGRYGDEKLLYLSSFFDFNDDGDWGDIFTCVAPGDAPEHLLIQTVGGPGAFSVVNPLPDNVVIIDPSLWGPPPTRQSLLFELYFYSPHVEQIADLIWTRFRVEYDDHLWPSPDHKFVGTEFDYSLFGEVEDSLIENEIPSRCYIIQDHDTPAIYFEDFAAGVALAKYFDPLVYCDQPAYPLMIDYLEFYLYDFAEVGSVDVRVSLHRVSEDICFGPGTQTYLSEPLTVTTFYPEMTYLYLPHQVCVWEPFFISLQYATGEPGYTPSFLFDDEPYPCDTCHAWVWYLGIESQPQWWEWYDFWMPPAPGCPIIRMSGFANYPYCEEYYLCGDCTDDGLVDGSDVVHLIGYLFREGPPPEPLCVGDANCSGLVDGGDVVYLLAYLFRSGPPPGPGCCTLKRAGEEPASPKTKGEMPKKKAVRMRLPRF